LRAASASRAFGTAAVALSWLAGAGAAARVAGVAGAAPCGVRAAGAAAGAAGGVVERAVEKSKK